MVQLLKKMVWIPIVCTVLWCTVSAAAGGEKVYIVPVSGMVEPAMAAYIRRVILDIPGDAAVVFRMDTFGGRVDAAFEIVEAISKLPGKRSVAYVEKRAISAGALIALASGSLVMKKNTLIGDCAPITQTPEGHKELGEKTQTVLRAQFRTLAKRNGYPVTLAESMVSKDMEVYEVVSGGKKEYMDRIAYENLSGKDKESLTSKKTVVARGKLLTMDDHEALELGFSKASVENLDDALAAVGWDAYEKVFVRESWSENLVRMLQPFLSVLMLVGIAALYTEIKAPGFGIPGLVAILCLGLVFFNQYLAGLADYTELLVFIIGFLLMGVEIFVIPGFGIAGILALIVIGAGLVLSFQNFVVPDPSMPWEGSLMLKNLGIVSGCFLGALLVSLFLIRYVLPRLSRIVDGPYLSATLAEAKSRSRDVAGIVPGDIGISLTPLRPAGKVRIREEKVDAVSQGDFIAAKTSVQVLSVEANHVIVQPVEDIS